jgi:hypothetical protein
MWVTTIFIHPNSASCQQLARRRPRQLQSFAYHECVTSHHTQRILMIASPSSPNHQSQSDKCCLIIRHPSPFRRFISSKPNHIRTAPNDVEFSVLSVIAAKSLATRAILANSAGAVWSVHGVNRKSGINSKGVKCRTEYCSLSRFARQSAGPRHRARRRTATVPVTLTSPGYAGARVDAYG